MDVVYEEGVGVDEVVGEVEFGKMRRALEGLDDVLVVWCWFGDEAEDFDCVSNEGEFNSPSF